MVHRPERNKRRIEGPEAGLARLTVRHHSRLAFPQRKHLQFFGVGDSALILENGVWVVLLRLHDGALVAE